MLDDDVKFRQQFFVLCFRGDSKSLIVFYGVKTVRPLRLELSFFAFELLPFSEFY